jgi:hypothetical protein
MQKPFAADDTDRTDDDDRIDSKSEYPRCNGREATAGFQIRG